MRQHSSASRPPGRPRREGVANTKGRHVSRPMWPSLPPGPRVVGSALYPGRRRTACSSPSRVPRRPPRRPLWAGQDRFVSSTPRLLGGPGCRRRRVRSLVPDVPAHQGGPQRATWVDPSPTPSDAARRDDRRGLDRWPPEDGLTCEDVLTRPQTLRVSDGGRQSHSLAHDAAHRSPGSRRQIRPCKT